MKRLITNLLERMKRKVKLPWVSWSVPAGVFAIAGLVAVTGVSIYATSRPIFCTTCHEMSVHYKSWSLSSHKNVECEQCHMMPSVSGMIKTKLGALRLVYVHTRTGGKLDPFKIKGHVPDANCKRCHKETREVVVYHGLKITHRKHWNMGVGCTFCHARVVHGPNAATKNTPEMTTCFKCHDGKTASNNCGTCHETLGRRNPSPFSPEWVAGHKQEVKQSGEASCLRCHQKDSCDACHRMSTPHPDNWLKLHAAKFRENPGNCDVCHPKAQREGFCTACHNIRRAHTVDWVTKHQTVVKQDPQACDSCHQKEFCSDCHKRYQSHPSDWLQQHPGEAKSNPERCKTCHSGEFCVGCHTNKLPPSHERATWLQTHKTQVAKDATKCQTCHKPDFCMSCHRSKKPQSHGPGWETQHSEQAKLGTAACNTCHAKDFCSNCHGMQMPHPSDWIVGHRAVALKSRTVCQRCHKPNACQSCHRGSRPASHTDNWVSTHGAVARRGTAYCENCHTKQLCQNCHANTRPVSHGENWLSQHGKQVDSSCDTCHTKAKCESCHKSGNKKPSSHTKDWLKIHPKQAKTGLKGCLMCHNQSFCTGCHGTPMPHPSGWAMGGHKGVASFDKKSMCFNCHDHNYCYSCHEKKPSNT